jgi:dipeptidyl aminopeptidase/acylaminoacyl peptidase
MVRVTSTRPYGTWPTPVTSELVVRAARTPTAVAFDGDDVWWSEARPEEGGRIAVVRRSGSAMREVLPAPWNARTAVHEYGGGAWWARGEVLWFTDWATHRLHRLAPGDVEPVALTPSPDVPRGLRYADGDVSPDGLTILCVRESHDGAVRNEVVRLSAVTPGEPEVVVSGPDFVACPRWRPDGAAWAWIEWDHPDMPWDATRLVMSDGVSTTVVAGGDVRESICQAGWAPDGSLWFSGDRSGFWSLYRWTPGGVVESMVELERDIGVPHWVFGESCFAFLDAGRVAIRFVEDGADHLAIRDGDGRIERLAVPYASIGGLRGRGSTLLFVGATPVTEPHVVALPVVGLTAGTPDVVAPPRDLGVEPSWWSMPEPIEVPVDGELAHALLYRPRNPTCDGPPGERPPLIVVIHGGPTSAARIKLDVGYQYWTTRGFAVVDVNHRGSTGYGRAYRDLLREQWGVVDVADCAAVARSLVERGDVDGDRLCIRGGSAGGFTTLAALAFEDVFSAGASRYGVADLAALARDTHKFESRYLDGLVGPWPEAIAVYEARSPIFHVDCIDRPLAVFQGLDDDVVPPNQSQMIVDALRARAIPVVYVTFEGEGHGFRRAETIRAALDTELAFYRSVLRIRPDRADPEGQNGRDGVTAPA